VCPICQGTGTADQADRVTPDSRPFTPIYYDSTLVWQGEKKRLKSAKNKKKYFKTFKT